MARAKTNEEFHEEVKIKNPHIDINGFYFNGESKMTCTCKKCGYVWTSTARNLINKKKCLNCMHKDKIFKYPDISDDEFKNIVSKNYPDLLVTGTYKFGMQTITCICKLCGHKSRIRTQMLLEKTYKCNMCENGYENVIKGKNDVKTLNPVLYDMLVDKSVNDIYTINSRNKVLIKCQNCGKIHTNKTIEHIHKRGFKCGCMDGNSLGEKYMHEVLMQSGVDFEEEYNINDNFSYRYDFYINSNKRIIIEVQGKQHSIKSFETCGGRTLEEEKQNDINKRKYALENGIDEYIYIKSSESGYENFKKSILNSKLPKLIDLSKIDWATAYRKSLSSDMIKACNLWNDGYRVMQIVDKLHIGKGTVRRYLTYGNEAGICKYDHTKNMRTDVICLNTMKTYCSQRDAERDYDMKRGYLNDYLKNRRKHIIEGIEYKWMYLDEYIENYGEIESA